MVYIYEKNLNTNESRFYMEVGNENQAKKMVREMNLDSLYDDKFYYIVDKAQEKD